MTGHAKPYRIFEATHGAGRPHLAQRSAGNREMRCERKPAVFRIYVHQPNPALVTPPRAARTAAKAGGSIC
jgi:hypothetical protein